MQARGAKVLAVGAHPDDVEFMCAGTLGLLGEIGCEVHIATLTGGDAGSEDLEPSEIRKVRLGEARRACELLGAQYTFLGFDDFGIFVDDEASRRVAGLIREVDPSVVLTHPPEDYLSDHEMTSRLVRNACFAGPVPNYDLSRFTSRRSSSGIPYLYYSQPIEGIDIFGNPVQPHFYVNIGRSFALKEKMLACHESQRAWLQAHHGLDEYLDSMRRWARRLAEDAANAASEPLPYAEGFRQHRGHAYPAENILAQWLGELVIEPDPTSMG